MSDDEHQVVATAAAKEGLAIGALAAQTVLAVARGCARPEHASLRERLASMMQAARQARRVAVTLNQAASALN
ncbi:hypothetical protein [Actinomadura miaoliensis]|uniref:ANTAR domain-containing protein n=1 Tax=Actinomadura miaoliensis TaxID=430685 RepID=A0ABP7WC17_9ACTN